jgi:hypothetical protein
VYYSKSQRAPPALSRFSYYKQRGKVREKCISKLRKKTNITLFSSKIYCMSSVATNHSFLFSQSLNIENLILGWTVQIKFKHNKQISVLIEFVRLGQTT